MHQGQLDESLLSELASNTHRHLLAAHAAYERCDWTDCVTHATMAIEQAAEWYWERYPEHKPASLARAGKLHTDRLALMGGAAHLSDVSATAAFIAGSSVLTDAPYVPTGNAPLSDLDERVARYEKLLSADPALAGEAQEQIRQGRLGLGPYDVREAHLWRERALYVAVPHRLHGPIRNARAPANPADFTVHHAEAWLSMAKRLIDKVGVENPS